MDRPRESNPRPPAPQSSAPLTGVNLPRLSSAVFDMFFRHVLNNKSTRCTILQVTIFLEFIRKYIILLTLNLRLTHRSTEKETSTFYMQRLPSRHAINGETFFAHLYLSGFFQWSTVTVFTVSSTATSTCSRLKLNSRKTDSRFKNCLLKHEEVEGTLRSHASPSSKMSV